MTDTTYTTTRSELESFCSSILQGYGTAATSATLVAEALVAADCAGHVSHGVRQLPYYVGQIQRGELLVDAEPEVIEERPSLVVADGRFGFGHLVAAWAVDQVVARARSQGSSVIAVRNANHIGRLGAYTSRVADDGLAAILLVNNQGSAEMQVAPTGGLDRRLTNNPISFAAPGGPTLDIALSVSAEGKVHHANELGRAVPAGWIVDSDGNPTTDPADYLEGGSMLPIGGLEGGYKGYAMIVLVEAIVGLLTGGGMAGRNWDRFSNAFVLIAADPGSSALDAYMEQLEVFAAWVKSSRRRDGVAEILIPGEPEARSAANMSMITLDQATAAALGDLAREGGVQQPWTV